MSSEIAIQKFTIGPLQTNCYLVYDKTTRESVIIDPAVPEHAIKDHIRKEGLAVKCVINTHGHFDHIMGDSFFSVPVYIHELDAECLEDPAKSLGGIFNGLFTIPDKIIKLKDGDTVKFGLAEMTVIHTPGHTAGGVSLLVGKHLFSGDTLFHEGVGRTDLPGGSYEAIKHSICDRLFKLPDDTKVYPGHGSGTTIRHEKENNPFV